MFVRNIQHSQTTFTGFNYLLSPKQNKELLQSKEQYFYNLVFAKIDETIFKPLFSEKLSRPNAPINILVGALILKELYNWSYAELMDNISFNLLTKTALGLHHIEECPFCYATIFNFQNRIAQYEQKNEKNLFDEIFNKLTLDQLNRLGIKTDIQRSDSTLIGSNTQKYSRLQLLIEVILRFYKQLTEQKQAHFQSLLAPYLNNTSQGYIYLLKSSDLPAELAKIGQVYQQLLNEPDFDQTKSSYKNLKRAYQEHFIEIDNKVQSKENEELTSGALQSPDDVEATYRKKDKQQSIGRIINVFETCNPENPLQLITDVSVTANNIDDSKILNERIDTVKEKTPDLNELHTDGGYGSCSNDIKLTSLTITHIQTAVRGREAAVEIIIEPIQNQDITPQENNTYSTTQTQINQDIQHKASDTDTQINYQVSCPVQSAESKLMTKNYKAKFDTDKCVGCSLMDKCTIFKNKGVYRFKPQDALANQRNRTIFKIPYERRKLRANVESTIYGFKQNLRHDKLKVRGTFKTKIYAFSKAISINFGRIYRYELEKTGDNSPFFVFLALVATFMAANAIKSKFLNALLARKLHTAGCYPLPIISKNVIAYDIRKC